MEQKTLTIVARAKDEASAQLSKVKDTIDDVADKVNKSSGGLSGFSSAMSAAGDKMKSVGTGMSIGLTAPIVALGVATMNSLQHIETLGAQTDAVIKSTGSSANVTRQQVEDMATSFEKLTGVEGETVQAGANMMLTFTNIKNGVGEGNDVFTQSNKVLLDMATAMNGGVVPAEEQMKAQAIQLGKALNDPIKGVSALSKVGVTFTDQQKEQIKTMVESGDTMGAQKLILAELNKEFGGSAESFGATTAGKVAKLKNEFGNLTEGLMVQFMPTLNKVVEYVGQLMEKFQALSPEQQQMILMVIGIVAAVGPLLIVLGQMVTAIGAIGGAFGFLAANPVILAVIAVILLIAGLAYLIITNWEAIKTFFAGLWEGLKAGWQGFLDFMKGLWDGIVSIVKFVIDVIKAVIMTYINIYIAIFNGFLEGIKAIWNAIWAALKFVFELIVAGIRLYIDIWIGIVRGFVNGVVGLWNWLVGMASSIFNGIGNAIRGVFSWVASTASSIFQGIVNTIGNVFSSVSNVITAPFKAAFNGIASLWNNTIGKISFTAPDWVPGIGGKGFSMPKIPMLATGGIATGPVMAMVGEGRESEAILPLSKLEGMLNVDRETVTEDRSTEVKVEVNVNGNLIGDDSSIRNLAITIGQEVDRQLRAQGTNNVNLLRTTP